MGAPTKIAGLLMAGMLTAASASGAEYVLAAGFSVDDNDGLSVSLFGDVAVGESTWLGMSLAATEARAADVEIQSRAASINLAHQIGKVLVNASAGVWGDPDALDSSDFSLGLTYAGAKWRVGVEALRRDLDLTFSFVPDDFSAAPVSRAASAKADGVAARIRYETEGDVSWSLRGKRFDYNRNLDRLTVLDFARRLVPTTLILADGLRDTSISAAVEWPLGDHLVGIELSRDQLGVGDIDIDGIALSWVRPVRTRSDLEFILGMSRADADDSVYLQVLYYFFGGS